MENWRKYKDFMKARAGLLMLLIGLISFTGFGFSTADLNQNSKADIVQMDDAVSVVTVASLEVAEINTFNHEAAVSLAENKAFLSMDAYSGTHDKALKTEIVVQPRLNYPKLQEVRDNLEPTYNFSNTITSNKCLFSGDTVRLRDGPNS